ncbi:diguanylate cyclase [Geobacter pelophilus]|uniref:diguanylate cyclase n=1 Tax=Geoanaerobacter pelophilus TaxID=60036 RepID=A0AAW4KZY3_9BACT|nr:diguanylate cyclase [Geoanaerobacter pelophilus]MBT0662832.1 diguanylate cyclase [Geoanaerobacter pelophilus]
MNDDSPLLHPFQHPILIVDDDNFMRTIIEASLKAAGYQVVTARNGHEALETFRGGYFPIVMTDWVMPEMDGLELCKAIRADDSGRYTYIILLTSQGSKNDLIAGLDAGADEYLVKPPHQQELLTRIKTGRRIIELESKLNDFARQVESLSLVDSLTGVFNRRYMEERIPSEIKRAYRYGRALSVIMISIDCLDQMITTNGFLAGDLLLKSSAGCLLESVRKEIDWIARYSEDRFVAVLPETDAQGAMILAKRLKIRIGSQVLANLKSELKVSTSIGVSGFTPTGEKEGFSMQMLLTKAEDCLSQSIAEGGDAIKGVQIK